MKKKDLSSKIGNATKALNALNRALKRDWQHDEELRDAVIQRFEFSLETLWKYYQAKYEVEGLLIDTPKAVFRQIFASGLISESECKFALDMIDARNKTSHTYNAELAEEIAAQVPEFYEFLSKLLPS